MPPKKGTAPSAKGRTTKSTQELNGTPTPSNRAPSKASTHNDLKSPTAQPMQLSAEDYNKLRDYLETKDQPFTVQTSSSTQPSKSKKRKRGSVDQIWPLQDDLFEDRLSVSYKVNPRDKWEKLRRYKKFTVGNESIATGQCILVKHDDSEEPKVDVASQWKAKVLEVRALDTEHVYLRVSWLNRPADLDGGKRKYHGTNELIPTNQMDIIDAMAVNGALPVEFWDEYNDEKNLPAEDQYFWRQTYDVASGTFSELRKLCIDNKPQNPDELIVSCSNPKCLKWMHVRCIGDQALQRAVEEQAAPKKSSKPQKRKDKLKNPANNPKRSHLYTDTKGTTKVEVFIEGHPDKPDIEPAVADEIVITLGNGEQYSAEMRCLFCNVEIESD